MKNEIICEHKEQVTAFKTAGMKKPIPCSFRFYPHIIQALSPDGRVMLTIDIGMLVTRNAVLYDHNGVPLSVAQQDGDIIVS